MLAWLRGLVGGRTWLAAGLGSAVLIGGGIGTAVAATRPSGPGCAGVVAQVPSSPFMSKWVVRQLLPPPGVAKKRAVRLGCPVPVTPPRPFAVAVTSPSSGATLSGIVTLAASVTGPGVSISTVSFKVDGTTVGTDSTAPYTFSWDTSTAAPGQHSFTATGVDSGANARTSPAVLATVSNGSSGGAVLFAATTGTSNCVRSTAGLVSFSTAVTNNNVCSSFNAANVVAHNGDTVLVESGTYAHQTILYTANRSVADGTCSVQPTGAGLTDQANLTNCVTFAPDQGASVSVNGFDVLTQGVRIINMTSTNPVPATGPISLNVTWENVANGVACKTVPQPHDDIFDGMTLKVAAGTQTTNGGAPLAAVGIVGVYNVAVINSTFGPTYDNNATWQLSDLTQASSASCGAYTPTQLQDFHDYVGHNVDNGLIQDISANNSAPAARVSGTQTVAPGGTLLVDNVAPGWPDADFICQNATNCSAAAPTGRFQYSAHTATTFTLPAGGTFVNGDVITLQNCSNDSAQYGCNHIAGIHWRASNSWLIGNKFTNIAQQDVEVQTFGTTCCSNIASTTISENIFDKACSAQPAVTTACGVVSSGTLTLTSTNPADTLTNDIVSFNSIYGGLTLNNDGPAATPFPGTVFIGNLYAGGSCTLTGGTMDYNAVTSSATCGPHDVQLSPTATYPYVNPTSPTYDFSLSGTPSVSNLIPTSLTVGVVTVLCPAHDYSGAPRPASGSGACAAGAYEPAVGGIGNVWMSVNGTAAPGAGNCTWHSTPVPDPDLSGVSLCGSMKNVIAAAGNNAGTAAMVPGTYGAQNPAAPYTSSRATTSGTCDLTVNRAGWTYVENTSGCLTFQPSDGGVPQASSVTVNGAVDNYSVGIRVRNLTVTNGSFGTNWRNGNGGTPCSGPKPHDIVFEGLRNYVTSVPAPGTAVGASFNFNSTDNYAVLNTDIGPTYDGNGTAQSQDYQPSASAACGAFTQPQIKSSNGAITGNNLHDDPIMVTVTNNSGVTTVNGNQTVSPGGQLVVNGTPHGWPAADFICQNSPACASNKPASLAFRYQYSALGTNTITLVNGGTFTNGDQITIQDCGGSGGPSDNAQIACNHAEAIHWRASAGNIFDNKFTNDGQYDINVQTFTANSSIDGTAIVQNVFDQPCSNQTATTGGTSPTPLCGAISALRIICNSTTDTVTNFIDAFNTVSGDNEYQYTCTGSTGGTAFAGSVLYGNLQVGMNSTACGWFKNNGGVTDYNYRTTENSGVVCGTHDVATTSTFASLLTNPNPPTYDFHLAGSAGSSFAPCSATVNGQSIVAPLTDLDGKPRPSGASTCAAGAYEPATQTGASLATCTGGTCTEGALPSTNFSNSCTATAAGAFDPAGTGFGVRLGAISDGVQNECRDYVVYVPAGLQGSAPVVVYAHGSNGCPDNAEYSDIPNDNLDGLANANKMIIMSLGMPHPCSGRSLNTTDIPPETGTPGYQWFHHEANYPDSTAATPQDYTFIQSAIADIKARLNGSNPTFPGITADAKRFWYMGQSSGGGLATGIMCNDATSSLFRGITYNGVGYNVASTGGTSPVPINGTERCGGGNEPLATNKKFFLAFVPVDGVNNRYTTGFCATSFTAGNPSPDGHCTPTSTESQGYWRTYFGCNAPTSTAFGSPSAANTLLSYSNCVEGNLTPDVEVFVIPGSGDGYNTADDVLNGSANTNGFRTQQVFDFFNSSTWSGP